MKQRKSHPVRAPDRQTKDVLPVGFITDRYLRLLVDHADVGLNVVRTGSGRIVYANPYFCHMVGYELAEIVELGLTVLELTHPDDLELNVTQLRRIFRGEINTFTIEKRYVRKDGAPYPVQVTTDVIERNAEGKPVVMVGTVHDLSNGKATDAATRSRDGIPGVSSWSRDLRTNTATCSAEHRELLGLRPHEPAPSFEQFLSRVHPDDQARLVEETARASKGVVLSSEFRIIRPGGEVRWVYQSTKPTRDEREEVAGLVGVCLDITDTREDAFTSHAANTIRLVKRYVDLHWNETIDLADLATAANVHMRTLYQHCKRGLGFTPHDYIKRVRLNHARALLQEAAPSATVTEIAFKCRFQNLGHFALDYRNAFGERPSETLKRSRSAS